MYRLLIFSAPPPRAYNVTIWISVTFSEKKPKRLRVVAWTIIDVFIVVVPHLTSSIVGFNYLLSYVPGIVGDAN